MDLDKLEALARAAGSDKWHVYSNGSGTGKLHDTHVWGGDGDAVARCFGNIGHMPEAIEGTDVSAFVATANPAAILEMCALIRKQEAEIVALGNLHVVQAAASAVIPAQTGTVDSIDRPERSEDSFYHAALDYRGAATPYASAAFKALVMVVDAHAARAVAAADKAARQNVARALDLGVSQSSSFAWGYLLGLVKECVAEDSAPQQQAPARDLGIEAAIMGEVLGGSEAQCTMEALAKMLVEHIAKGDPVDIANFAMMLHQREAASMEHHPCYGGDAARALKAAAGVPHIERDAARLDFVLDNCAFICTIDEGMYQLMTQDDDEDYHVMSGEGEAFKSKRDAVDTAMEAQQGQKAPGAA